MYIQRLCPQQVQKYVSDVYKSNFFNVNSQIYVFYNLLQFSSMACMYVGLGCFLRPKRHIVSHFIYQQLQHNCTRFA